MPSGTLGLLRGFSWRFLWPNRGSWGQVVNPLPSLHPTLMCARANHNTWNYVPYSFRSVCVASFASSSSFTCGGDWDKANGSTSAQRRDHPDWTEADAAHVSMILPIRITISGRLQFEIAIRGFPVGSTEIIGKIVCGPTSLRCTAGCREQRHPHYSQLSLENK